ncbi:distal tail protein Dit [Lactococcus sp.]|uniref:distal tail protein Dit n=1 Tax=Lactococcus sp. TaxID=44273 RepID=UPI0035B44012
MLEVKYGDDKLSDFVRFISIGRGISSESDVTTQENSSDGEEILYVRRKAKSITATFRVKKSIDKVVARRELARILSVTETKVLTFNDEPNIYYNAIPSGAIAYNDDGYFWEGTVTFLVPDGIAHRTNRSVLNFQNSGGVYGTLTKNSDGSIDGTVINNGTKPAFMRATITNNKETGFLGLINSTGVFQMGQPEEGDGVTYQQSETLINATKQADFDALPYSTKVNAVGIAMANVGTVGWKSDGLRMLTPGTAVSGKGWRGHTKVFKVPADSNGEIGANKAQCDFNLLAWAGAMGQTGIFQIAFLDASGNLIASYLVYKNDTKGNQAHIRMTSSLGIYFETTFETNNGESNQKSPNKAFNSKTGGAWMRKNGSQVQWYYNGSIKTQNVPALQDVKIDTVEISMGAAAASTKFITNLSLRKFSFTKMYVDKWKDVPNRYGAGSQIVVDSEYDSVTVDTRFALSDKITGSDFLKLPVGESTIQLVQSAWNTTAPELELSWEELIL